MKWLFYRGPRCLGRLRGKVLRKKGPVGIVCAAALSVALGVVNTIAETGPERSGPGIHLASTGPVKSWAQGVVGEMFEGRVTRVIDGDTFWMDAAETRIRVWGLDAPELGEPGGDSATGALRGLIGDTPVTCRTRDIDRFGRIVGQCYLADGRDMTRAMIETGTATEFCRFSRNFYGTC